MVLLESKKENETVSTATVLVALLCFRRVHPVLCRLLTKHY